MSYLDPRYLAESGEVSASFRPAGTEPDLTYDNGVRTSYLATGATSDGGYGLYRWDFSEAASGPGTHFHRSMSEAFFILDGTVRLFNGEQWVDATAGDFLYVPPGGLHAFRNESGAKASMLILFSPGAPREKYFEGLLEGLARTRGEAFYLEHDQVNVPD